MCSSDLDLRRTLIPPLLASGFLGGTYDLPHDAALAVDWKFTAGNLRLVMNFGDDAVDAMLGENERIVWASEVAARDNGRVRLTRWTGAVVAGPA